VRRRLLHVAERHAGELVVKAGCVTVETLTVRGEEDRTVGALADGLVDRPGRAWRQRDRDDLAALAQDGQGRMGPLEAERFDVGAQRLGHPQPVDRQQRHQGMLGRPAQPGGHQQRADLVAPVCSGSCSKKESYRQAGFRLHRCWSGGSARCCTSP
jgi:hypothetical protein